MGTSAYPFWYVAKLTNYVSKGNFHGDFCIRGRAN